MDFVISLLDAEVLWKLCNRSARGVETHGMQETG